MAKTPKTEPDTLSDLTDGAVAVDPNAPKPRKAVKRLAPVELIPVAKPVTNGEAFAVGVTTGRQRETLTPGEAQRRAVSLRAAADAIDAVAAKVEAINAT
jgi:hypothetical protein